MSQCPNLPAIIPGARRREERVERTERGVHGAYHTQILGQSGARRGLKAGRPAIDQAHSAYLGAEWSGSADRRRAFGGLIGACA
jgi:hypothetical protein